MSKRDYSKFVSKGNYSSANIKKMKSEGKEVPRTDTKAHYREDMAAIDAGEDATERKRKLPRKTKKRFYENFDRGTKRSAKKKTLKR